MLCRILGQLRTQDRKLWLHAGFSLVRVFGRDLCPATVFVMIVAFSFEPAWRQPRRSCCGGFQRERVPEQAQRMLNPGHRLLSVI